ncbi:hypothetical protein FDECE_4799 [Fusarium decemcellulare]|nr:hypothetical protein FDECE_4799 [Fusarium decemcellulare]
MGFEWSFMALSYIFVVARLYSRLWLRGNKIYSADYWLMNAMDDFMIQNESLAKIRFATNYLFNTGMYFPKFSILAFYFNLVPVTRPRMRIALYTLAGLTTTCALTTLFTDTFWCGRDPSVNWKLNNGSCNVFADMHLMRLKWAMNFTTEVLNVIYPFPLLQHLKLQSRRERFGLGIIFALGTITIIVSIGRFISMVTLSNDISIYIWATAEICISIMVVSLTALRPLLRQLGSVFSSNIKSSDAKSGYRISSRDGPCEVTPGAGRLGHFWQSRHRTPPNAAMELPEESLTGSEVELNDTRRSYQPRETFAHDEECNIAEPLDKDTGM